LHNVSLLRIVGGHLNATLGKTLVHRGNHVVIAAQFDSKRRSYTFTREVVFGWAETSGEDDDVGAFDRRACDRNQVVKTVADDSLEGDDHAHPIKLIGEEKGVGVLTERSEHLRADRNDFSDHQFSLKKKKTLL
jgi:hypothetical protein